MDVQPIGPTAMVVVIQAVTLGQKVLTRSRSGDERCAHWCIQSSKLGLWASATGARILHGGVMRLNGHRCGVVRQVEQRTGRPRGKSASRVQAEEEDSGTSGDANIGADVEFWKG